MRAVRPVAAPRPSRAALDLRTLGPTEAPRAAAITSAFLPAKSRSAMSVFAVFPPYRSSCHGMEVTGGSRLLFISGLNGYIADRANHASNHSRNRSITLEERAARLLCLPPRSRTAGLRKSRSAQLWDDARRTLTIASSKPSSRLSLSSRPYSALAPGSIGEVAVSNEIGKVTCGASLRVRIKRTPRSGWS